MLLLVAIVILLRNGALCYNLQTKLSTILRPLIDEVDLEHPINFGVSMAALQTNQNSTILLAGAPAADLGDHYEKPGSVFNCDLNERIDFENFSHQSTVRSIDCKPVRFTNLIRGSSRQVIINDYMQMGTSMSSKTTGDFTFCAAGALNLNIESHYPNGQCWFGNYGSASNTPTKNEVLLNKLISINPLNETKKQTSENTYYFSHGMFGFSSKLSKDDAQTEIFYGAPGFNAWRGAVIQVKLTRNGTKMTNLYRHDFSEYIYFGFSITLARLFNDKKLLCVVSAPKAKSTGAVIIFEPSPANRLKMVKEIRIYKDKLKTIYGTTNGEYFGCALEAIDLNNDGFDDIIVGSPYYSMSAKELMDNGAVYIYMSNGNDFEDPAMLFGSSESNSMFGYSIASAGDLDQDGYQDFVVGAPYEENSGCVYVYNGRPGTPSIYYSQKICAKQFKEAYRGFGIQIQGQIDVDSNKYPDLAIGAYLSKNVVLLKSRPVARLSTKFNLNVTSINLNDKSAFCWNERNKQWTFCFELTLCQTLNIKHAENLKDQVLTTILQLDVFKLATLLSPSIHSPTTSSSRAYFELNANFQSDYKKYFSNNSSTTNSITFQYKLAANTMICYEPFLIMLRNDIEDKLKPILITSTHRLNKKEDCVRNCPVLLNEDQQFTESITFHTGCKRSKCMSKLNLKMDLQTQQNYENPNDTKLIELKQLIIGFHQYTILNVRLTNDGEQAYSTNLELILKPPLQIKKIESRCRSKYEIDEASYLVDTKNRSELLDTGYLEIVCNLGNPFEKGLLDLKFVFDLFHTKLDTQIFTITGSVHTTSDHTNDSQLQSSLSVPLRRQVYVSLKDTQQTANTMLFDFKTKNASIDKITFVSHFQVFKNGFSNIPLLDLIVHVPTNYTNLTLIHGVNIESLDGSSSLPCDQIKFDSYELISDSDLMYRNQIENVESKTTADNFTEISEDSPSNEAELIESADFMAQTDENKLYTNGQLNLNCQTTNCTKFKCSIQSIGFSKQIRLFRLTGNIDLNMLELVLSGLSNFSMLKLKSDLKLSIPDSLIDLYQELDETGDGNQSVFIASHSAYVTIKQIPGQEKLAYWIILTSLLTGLFILFILIISLIKCGFFKRTKRDEIRKFKKKQRETLLLLNPLPQVDDYSAH